MLADPDDEENVDELRPDDADQRWLSIEYALAALTTDGAEEAYHLLRDVDAVTTVADSGHPDSPVWPRRWPPWSRPVVLRCPATS